MRTAALDMKNGQASYAALAQDCYEDPALFMRVFLSKWFKTSIPWVHRGLLAILTGRTQFLLKYGEIDKIITHFVWRENPDDEKSPTHAIFALSEDGTVITMEKKQFTEIIMPRGFSKTTLLNGVNIYLIEYQCTKYLVYLSESATHAESQLDNVATELRENDKLISVFGEIMPDRRSKLKDRQDFFETTTGVKFAAKGRGSQIRGSLVKGDRPDRILIDDVETTDSVETDEQKKKARRWLYQDVIPALPESEDDNDGEIVMLGTILASDALMLTVQKDPRFNSICFGAIDNDGDALWHYKLSLEKYALKKEAYAAVGELDSFYREYDSKIRDEETAIFKSRYIIVEPPKPELEMFRALMIDPSISQNVKADFCGFAVVGIEAGPKDMGEDREVTMSPLANPELLLPKKALPSLAGKIHVLDIHLEKGMTPRDQINKYFELRAKWKPHKNGVEAQAYQAALVHILREEMFRRHDYFEIEEIRHGAEDNKIRRIKMILQPRYAAGYVVHSRIFGEYTKQLLEFPVGKKDGPDVVAMAIALLDPYAAMAADSSKDPAADEYDELDEQYGRSY